MHRTHAGADIFTDTLARAFTKSKPVTGALTSINEDITVLSSTSLSDVFHTLSTYFWDHSFTPRKLKENSICLIVPDKKVRKRHVKENAPCGVLFRVQSVNSETTTNWPSNSIEGSNQKYRARILGKPSTFEVLSLEKVENILSGSDKRGSKTGIKYMRGESR